MNWRDEALRLYHTYGRNWSIIADEMMSFFPGLSHFEVKEKIRSYVRRTPEYKKALSEDYQRSSIEYKADGTLVSEKFISVRDGDDMTPEYILEAHGLKASLWEVVSYKNNWWNTQLKGGKKQISYQSKLTVKPRTKDTISFDDIDTYFSKKTFQIPVLKPANYDPCGEILEVNLPDLHSGLLAWRAETGADYDMHIVKDRFCQCASDIFERCKSKKLKKIVVVTLGDLLHFDNENQTTTKGTFQQADGRLPKIFDLTLDMMIDFLTVLGGLAPVEVIYVPGNHDRVVGYMLLKSLEMAFRCDSKFVFDTTPNPQKYRLFGCALIGWTHGDMQKQNMSSWLQYSARKEFGESKFAEVHAGHLHSLTTKEVKRDFDQEGDVNGIVVRYLPTICNASYWEHQQGYISAFKTMVCYVWNETTGLRETWYSNIA